MWEIVQRAVSITTLFLLIIMISIVFSNGTQNIESNTLSNKLEQYREETRKVADNHLSYLETRINRNQETQDRYQNTSSRTLSIIENRLKVLEDENKSLKNQGKIVNNNNNNSNAVINIPSLSQ